MGFKNFAELQNELNKRTEIAIKNVARIMVKELEKYIRDDFYSQYKPKYYVRTYQLLKSPTFNFITSNSAEIFINIDSINYLIGDPSYESTEEDIVKMASMGYHGSYSIFRPGMFWEDFIDWANKNVVNLLKTELRSQGIKIK